MQHRKDCLNEFFPHTLTLAHGSCKCQRAIGQKGVPMVMVPWSDDGDNIDLFPAGPLWERGCDINYGSIPTLVSPKGHQYEIKMWGGLP